MSFISKVVNFYNQDPKPIFDHIRNIGIATVIVLGGRLALVKSSDIGGFGVQVGQFMSWSLVAIGSVLFIINMNYGVRSISSFFLGRHANIGVIERSSKIVRIFRCRHRIKSSTYQNILKFYLKEWSTQVIVLIYYISILLIIASNALNSGLLDIEKPQSSSEVYLNVKKVSDTLEEQREKLLTKEKEIESLKGQLHASEQKYNKLLKSDS
ncbi:hypothetical protein BCU30_015990 [Vibrio lentus]|uniref:hypothetical protein n=1 Tax=Vibrio lentus TaxID=136468 RepID=UPI000C864664|nr:hypothetical protein [Vibrio lentus]PMG18417.1 hypothetical protein BCU96_24680 [Vibrio lentus]PMH10334.1 hypothetical protein BCU76_24640 [Vibrio lentus]PMJ07922.1 hypothetical protein BCU30_24950 [Vibrio lentus]PMK87177.1 hypothetical protein BCT89_24800 [Vibrio lentus]PMN09233.1 hypothetical protein BCT39_25000 [Vibrio lentus]